MQTIDYEYQRKTELRQAELALELQAKEEMQNKQYEFLNDLVEKSEKEKRKTMTMTTQ